MLSIVLVSYYTVACLLCIVLMLSIVLVQITVWDVLHISVFLIYCTRSDRRRAGRGAEEEDVHGQQDPT